MINFSTKVIKDEAQTRLTDGVMSTVEFSGFNLKIADDKEELFLRVYDSMKSVKNLIDASNIVSDISKDFKPNDPKIKKLFELIGDNEDLVSDILSFMYNRIAQKHYYKRSFIMDFEALKRLGLAYMNIDCEKSYESYNETNNNHIINIYLNQSNG